MGRPNCVHVCQSVNCSIGDGGTRAQHPGRGLHPVCPLSVPAVLLPELEYQACFRKIKYACNLLVGLAGRQARSPPPLLQPLA